MFVGQDADRIDFGACPLWEAERPTDLTLAQGSIYQSVLTGLVICTTEKNQGKLEQSASEATGRDEWRASHPVSAHG